MAYFIFTKDLNDVDRTIYKIAENEYDLNNLNIVKSNYKIIEDSLSNFEAVKYGIKNIVKYNNNIITYEDITTIFVDDIKDGIIVKSAEKKLNDYILNYKNIINQFLKNNQNHQLFNRWNDYYNQLNALNANSIQYPLNTSLEQYFKGQNQTSLNPLQLP
jgi:hypothetical protein